MIDIYMPAWETFQMCKQWNMVFMQSMVNRYLHQRSCVCQLQAIIREEALLKDDDTVLGRSSWLSFFFTYTSIFRYSFLPYFCKFIYNHSVAHYFNVIIESLDWNKCSARNVHRGHEWDITTLSEYQLSWLIFLSSHIFQINSL